MSSFNHGHEVPATERHADTVSEVRFRSNRCLFATEIDQRYAETGAYADDVPEKERKTVENPDPTRKTLVFSEKMALRSLSHRKTYRKPKDPASGDGQAAWT
jgi:hypothetical protein